MVNSPVINTLNAVTLPDFVQGCTQYISVETAPILQQQSRSWGQKTFRFWQSTNNNELLQASESRDDNVIHDIIGDSPTTGTHTHEHKIFQPL